MNPDTNSWLKSCISYHIDEVDGKKYLTAYLKNGKKHNNPSQFKKNTPSRCNRTVDEKTKNVIQKNKIRLHPVFENVNLYNFEGWLRYDPTPEQNNEIKDTLYPLYNGETINKIKIKECIMLSIDNEKYNKMRNETIDILKQYNLPKISTYFGYTKETISKSKYYKCMVEKRQRNELTCGRLEIFEKFVNESNGNEWLLHFEDDVRPVNIDVNENLNYLYNIPKDAEFIRPYLGHNKHCKLENVNYKETFNGGLNHAFYISTNGCKKVLNYAKKYGWKHRSDVDLYQLSKFNPELESGYGGWFWRHSGGICDTVKVDTEDEKLVMYSMDHIIFNQITEPCAPLK